MSVIEMINDIRQEQRLTWAELAQVSGVTINTLYNWRHGFAKPTLANVEKTLDALNYELDLHQKG
tara:strand:+ start:505 stop:699 length:195 start_codon:yes stop_codon:yes gene_type:complete